MAKANSICSIEGCGKNARSLGLCQGHHLRQWRYGDPLAGGTAWGAALSFYRDTVLEVDTDECVTWPFATTHGHAVMRLNGKLRRVCRVVCEEKHGTPPTPLHEAAHSCGKGHEGCVNPRHLRWATKTENMADQYVHGVRAMGERHGRAKLTEQDVRAIRGLAGVMSQSKIAAKYGVSRESVRAIHHRKSWGWLDP